MERNSGIQDVVGSGKTEVSDEEYDETMTKAGNIIRGMFEESIKTFPMWMRFNVIRNMLSNSIRSGNFDGVDWDKVNSLLRDNVSETDFNAFGEIRDIIALDEARLNCIAACEGLGVWLVRKCVTCGEEFHMTKKEVDFYKRNRLEIPKRCIIHRHSYKAKQVEKPKNEKKQERTVVLLHSDGMTAMEIAMRKAEMKKAQQSKG